MRILNVYKIAGMAAAAALAFTGCDATDVVAQGAVKSFAAVIDASGKNVAWSDKDSAWSLSSPEGDQVVFSPDFSRNGKDGKDADMDNPDVEFVFDARPFVTAGLDISKLPSSDGIRFELEDGKFMLHFEFGPESFASDAKKSINATFAEIVRTQRARIGYHEKLDHYGIKLGNGNMFEWARDMPKNDKDIVFVLNPEPFIAAGIDPAKIPGWIFAKVEMKDDAGKTIQVDKLLRPFNLR